MYVSSKINIILKPKLHLSKNQTNDMAVFYLSLTSGCISEKMPDFVRIRRQKTRPPCGGAMIPDRSGVQVFLITGARH